MDQDKKTLKEYKQDLDLRLSYYEHFIPLVKAIVIDNISLFEEYVSYINTLNVNVTFNKSAFLCEIPFDLTFNEIKILYNYGVEQFQRIENTFELVSSDISLVFGNNDLNKIFAETWHTKSNVGSVFIPYTHSHEGFIQSLFEKLKSSLSDFHNEFNVACSGLNEPNIEVLNIKQIKRDQKVVTPKTFTELFTEAEHEKIALDVLKQMVPPVIDSNNNYIGKNKGVFPIWVRLLLNHKPQLIKHFTNDLIYKELLNSKINGLVLSEDASEFRKTYKQADKRKQEMELLLSHLSQKVK